MNKLCLIFFLVLCVQAKAQSLCNEPVLVVPDTLSLYDNITLAKNPGCTKDFTYVITKAEFILGSGGETAVIALATSGKIPSQFYAKASNHSRISIRILEAKRILNGEEQPIPIGKWGSASRPVR